MNGQQLTNSSNSANVTPSSSYPASLSSQSSRDASPSSRTVPRKALPESYNHVTSPQLNHWAMDPPTINSSLAKSEMQDLQPAITQQPGGISRPLPPSTQPSSQPVYRFSNPAPSPQPNHLPQPNSITNQFPSSVSQPNSITNQFPPSVPFSHPQEPPRSNQSPPHPPLQASSNSQSFHQSNNQFQKPPSTVQQQPIHFQKTPADQPYQFSQPTPQTPRPPNPLQQIQNKFSHPPSQISQNQMPPSQNQFIQPPGRFSNAQNHLMSQPQNQFPQPQNQIPQLQHPYAQSQNQMTQVQNRFSHPPKQMPPSQNNLTQTPNHFSQPTNHYPQFPLQSPPQPQVQNRLPAQPPPPSLFNKRYPQMPPPASYPPNSADGLTPHLANMSLHQQASYQQPVDGLTPHVPGRSVNQGFNKLWGMDTVDLLQCRELVPPEKIEPPPVRLQHELYEALNCSPEIFRCTLTKIPETKSLLDKSRLPLGVLIHPFKDLNQLSVIQCTVIVRCRMCRTYINPFVYFVDNKRWKCNLCFRVNELPDEFQFDPLTKTYGDPSRRPEIKSATIEFVAPSEYMVRPPQPAVYVFVLDVSRLACECGYLDAVCRTLLTELDNLPGDARTSVAFITFDSAVHFYSLSEGQAQPNQMIVVDIDDMFIPTPDNLLVSLNECRELIRDLLQELPNKFHESYDTQSALGAALQAAYKLLSPTGGRVTVFQACLPNIGPGALTAREDPAQRAGDNPAHLNPSTDFYKKLALDCSGQQIAVDLFLVNCQYIDLATLSGVSRFSGGCMHHIPLYRSDKPLLVDNLERTFQRYLIRKIGFESVMRLRCTRGLSIHTFHGNFFVRSTDLLSLPNANPDAGFGMQVTIDENLTEIQNVCFQAALLYTSSKGERRIRVHTLCLPVASNLADVMHSADQQCIVGLLAKMAVDRAVQSSLSDAREAFVNVVADVLSAYRLTQSSSTVGCLLAPYSLRLLPLYILALLKHVAFRVGQSTRLDDRVFAMCQMKSLPLTFLMQSVYPDLYSLLNIEQMPEVEVGDQKAVQPPRLQLSSERVDSHGLYLMDDGSSLLIYVGHNLPPSLCQAVFQVPHFAAIPQELYSLPELDNPASTALRNFIFYLQTEKPFSSPLQVIRDDSPHRMRFLERLVEDKNESGTSYYEFLQRIKSLVK